MNFELILARFSPETSTLADKNIFWRIRVFMEEGRSQSLHFCKFDLLLPSEGDLNRKKYIVNWKNFSHWAIQIVQNLLSPFLTFCANWAIFDRKQGGATSQMVRIKIWHTLFYPHNSWSNPCKKVFFFYFYGYSSQRTFQKNFNQDFQVQLLFLIPSLHFWRK